MTAFQVKFPDLAANSVARTPMSGAWHEKGDIVKRDLRLKKYFPWCVECKCQKAMPTLERLLIGRTKLWQTAWEQAIDQAIAMDELPLLVWRKAPKDPILCAIPYRGFITVKSFDELACGPINIFIFDHFLASAVAYADLVDTDDYNSLVWRVLSRAKLDYYSNG